MTDTQPKPAPVKGGAVPYLSIDGAAKAAEFYQKAFGAELAMMQPVDEKGRTMHAHLYINGSSVMLSDFYPEHGHPVVPVQGFNIMLPTKQIDADYKRAIDAGCTPTMPPEDMFWGDRFAIVVDPFGHRWMLEAPLKK